LLERADEKEDHGAHGRFDENARERSPLLWMSENRAPLMLGAALAAVGAGIITARLGEAGGGEKK